MTYFSGHIHFKQVLRRDIDSPDMTILPIANCIVAAALFKNKQKNTYLCY